MEYIRATEFTLMTPKMKYRGGRGRTTLEISEVADTLIRIRRSIAITVEDRECPGCRRFTQTFPLLA